MYRHIIYQQQMNLLNTSYLYDSLILLEIYSKDIRQLLFIKNKNTMVLQKQTMCVREVICLTCPCLLYIQKGAHFY